LWHAAARALPGAGARPELAPRRRPCQRRSAPFRLNVQSNRRGAVSSMQDSTVRVPADLGEVIAEQERTLAESQPPSRGAATRAPGPSAGGGTSSWQITAPQPVWLSHGLGSKVYDVDGNEYVDLHGGYGVGLAGHAHPAIVEAVRRQVARGTHFAQPTRDAVAVADELAARFPQPLWRVSHTGTPAPLGARPPMPPSPPPV